MSRLSDSKTVCQETGIGRSVIGKGASASPFCLLPQEFSASAQANPLTTAVGPTSTADAASASSISREVKDIFGRASRAVVKIHGVDEHSDIYGTGFFVDPTGTLYTAYAVGG